MSGQWVDVKLGQGGAGAEAWPVYAKGLTSTVNATTTPLNAGQTYTGTGELNNYAEALVSLLTDQDGTLYIDLSPDGTNWDVSFTYPVNGGSQETHRIVKGNRYFRARLLNTSASNQTYLRLNSYFGSFGLLTSPLNSELREDADATIVRAIDSETDIAAGRHQGFSIVNKYGQNTDIDTGSVPEDVWGGGGLYAGFPDSTLETVEVISTSTADASAGTGARTIRVTGLDADYNVQSETITLNGLTAASGALTFRRVHTAQIITAGSGGVNAGTITVRHTTTEANVFLAMLPGLNQTNSSGYTVPAGFTAYLRRLHLVIKGTGQATQTHVAEGYIWTRAFGGLFRARRPFTVNTNSPYEDKIYGGVVFTEKSDIVIRIATVSHNDIGIAAGYDMILVKNI